MQPLMRQLFMRLLWLCLWGAAAAVQAQNLSGDNPEDSPIWQKVRASLFQARPITSAGNDVLTLEAPARAENAAIVPIAIRARWMQTPQHFIDKVYLVIDNNPAPVSATFHFTQLSGRADIETRVRIEQYTFVRAIAETNDGKLYMATRFVKASGGCSAPPGNDTEAALASLGRIKLHVDDTAHASQPVQVQLAISHPNASGLVMDQLTRLYAPAHFVQELRVTLAGEPVLSAELGISISENPNFRFYVLPRPGAELRAEVVDSQDLHFQAAVSMQGPVGAQPAPAPVAQQLASGVYWFAGAAGEADAQNLGRIGNVGFVVGDSGVVVINTGTSYRHGQVLLQAIRQVTDKPIRLALVTHTRPEFLMGAAAFQDQGIPVHMHHRAAELMRSRCERCLKKLQATLGPDAMQGTLVFKPDQEFAQGYALNPAGRALRVLYFGHSSGPGDVAVLDEASGTLFAGGLLDNQRIPDVQDGDLPGWLRALQSLRGMTITRIVPAHGAVGTPELLDTEARYLTQLQGRVAGLQQQGMALADIADAATLPEYAAWDGYPAVHKRNATEVYLRLERASLFKP